MFPILDPSDFLPLSLDIYDAIMNIIFAFLISIRLCFEHFEFNTIEQ